MANQNNPFSAVVVAVDLGDKFINDPDTELTDVWEVVLNIGAGDGVELGQRYVVFALGPELRDPVRGDSLGHYEIVRGIGKVSHVQERMCRLESTDTIQEPIYSAFP